jgi:hypothetical protein
MRVHPEGYFRQSLAIIYGSLFLISLSVLIEFPHGKVEQQQSTRPMKQP